MPRPLLAIGQTGGISYTQEHPGRWTASAYIRDRDGIRRRVRASGRSKTAARTALQNKLDHRVSFLDDEISPTMTVARLVVLWLDEHATSGKLAPQTADKYRRLINNHIIPGVGGLRLIEATTGRIDAWLKTLAKTTAVNARHARSVLSSAFGLAVRHDALTANPVRETASVAKNPVNVRALTLEELSELRQIVAAWQDGLDPTTGEPELALGGRPRATDLLDVIDMLTATGARIGEVLAIRWSDISLAPEHGKPTVTIAGTLVTRSSDGLIRQDHPKTKSGWRTITLPHFAVVMLTRRSVESQPSQEDVVFPSHAGTLRSPNNFRRQLRDAVEGTGYEWVTPHSFRRTVATLLDRQLDAEHAAAQLGHSDSSVTKAHYIQKAHQAPDMSDVLEQLGGKQTSNSN